MVRTRAQAIKLYPQHHRGIPCEDPKAIEADDRVQRAIRDAKVSLGERGRVVVRASGTQPLLRLMVESEDDATCVQVLEALDAAAKEALG